MRNVAMDESHWANQFEPDACRYHFVPVEDLRVTEAASPLQDDSVATPQGDVPARIPREVVVESIPSQLKVITFDLAGDLVLRLPPGFHDISVRAESKDLSHWVAITGGSVRSLLATECFVGGASAATSQGQVLVAYPTNVRDLEMQSVQSNSLMVGWVEATKLTVTGPASLQVVDFPVNHASEVRAGLLSVESRRVIVRSRLSVGRIGPGTRIACESGEAKVVIGDTLDYSESHDLRFEGGHFGVLRGEVSKVTLVDVETLEIGEEEEIQTDEPPDHRRALRGAIASHLGYGLVTDLSGHVRSLVLGHRAVVSGSPKSGFSAERISATTTSELSGIDARSFNLYSAGVLRDLRRLGLWVPSSTRKARVHFANEVQTTADNADRAKFELAHQRKRLLALAVDTQQDGHTLSVLREAEKDARRASLHWGSRERLLLECWNRLLGYGERILHPLVVGGSLVLVLGIGHVGWGRFWSRDWWSHWYEMRRLNSIINFALPGIDAFGIEGVGGFWGVSAKIVSVVFFASAAAAAIRVVKRSE